MKDFMHMNLVEMKKDLENTDSSELIEYLSQIDSDKQCQILEKIEQILGLSYVNLIKDSLSR